MSSRSQKELSIQSAFPSSEKGTQPGPSGLASDIKDIDWIAFYYSQEANQPQNEGILFGRTVYIRQAVGFFELVSQRSAYLESLNELGDNWTTGASLPPSSMTIDASRRILESFRSYVYQNASNGKYTVLPSLVMGPIPSGGIGLEFHIDNQNAMFVSIYNDASIELDVKLNDYYIPIKSRSAQLSDNVVTSYKALAEH